MSHDRSQLRRHFLEAWQKREYAELSALERQLLDVIMLHPEYHVILSDPHTLDRDYDSAQNPFLHMSLHVGLLEQLSTDRPIGIRAIYQALFEKLGDEHRVQHLMMDVMAGIIWDAQQQHCLPDEVKYVEQLKKLI